MRQPSRRETTLILLVMLLIIVAFFVARGPSVLAVVDRTPGAACAPPGSVAVLTEARAPKVLAVVDGAPGAGKTTLCLFVGRIVQVVSKDLDDFTQPVVNPAHPTAQTVEGRARRQRFLQLGWVRGIFRVREFIQAEIRDFISSVAHGTYIVFCGLAHIDETTILPDELANVPYYLFKPDRETIAKRVTLRALEGGHIAIADCESLQTSFDAVLSYARSLYVSMAVAQYQESSEDGAVILSAVLRNIPDVGDAAIEEIVEAYRAQPGTDERLRAFARSRGCRLVIAPT